LNGPHAPHTPGSSSCASSRSASADAAVRPRALAPVRGSSPPPERRRVAAHAHGRTPDRPTRGATSGTPVGAARRPGASVVSHRRSVGTMSADPRSSRAFERVP
jgi:hypothetical protein